MEIIPNNRHLQAIPDEERKAITTAKAKKIMADQAILARYLLLLRLIKDILRTQMKI